MGTSVVGTPENLWRPIQTNKHDDDDGVCRFFDTGTHKVRDHLPIVGEIAAWLQLQQRIESRMNDDDKYFIGGGVGGEISVCCTLMWC